VLAAWQDGSEGETKVTDWVNSADSHVLEPLDLWLRELPPSLCARGPVVETVDDREVVSIDGKVVRRDPVAFMDAIRPPGAEDPRRRLLDLDDQGIWAELIFPSRALWVHLSDDAALQLACSEVYNDWLYDEFMSRSGRFIGAAMLPVLDTDDAVRELQRNVARGFETVFLPTSTPAGREYNREEWKPLWAAAAEAGISLSFHIGTGADPKVYRGPGGAITNHVVSFYGAQTTLCHLVASGVLEDHPDLHVSFVESGGSWLPAVMERMDEAQRQYGGWFLRPKLPQLPSEYVKRQVHVSFQHGRAALAVIGITGLPALMWGSDYPHLEGTFPNTKAVLREIFDGVDDEVRTAITGGTFSTLFTVPARVPA
jgi:predicted TIM-barrel fold metal-dependent hydrolase